MNWLFELSAACALTAFVFPLVWKFLRPAAAPRLAFARIKTADRVRSADLDGQA